MLAVESIDDNVPRSTGGREDGAGLELWPSLTLDASPHALVD